jgi:DNA invertase Pin-like site-specific DNA recombinase
VEKREFQSKCRKRERYREREKEEREGGKKEGRKGRNSICIYIFWDGRSWRKKKRNIIPVVFLRGMQLVS